MRFQRHRAITFGVALALSVYLGPISGSANTAASSDQVATLADAIAERFAPTQLSALIAVAAGRAQPGADDTAPSLEQLQRALDVDRDVAVALLRIFDQRDGEAERLIKDLAQSTVLYHAVTDDLSGMSLDEPDGQHIIVQAQAAMNAGRFGDAEVEIHQLENLEVASADGSANGGAAPRSSEHRFTAAQARTLLGKIALMNLQYGKATEDFQLARQRLAMAPQEQPPVTDPKQVNASAVADASEPSSKISAAETDTNPDDQQQSTEATPPLPQLDLDWSQRIGPLMQEGLAGQPSRQCPSSWRWSRLPQRHRPLYARRRNQKLRRWQRRQLRSRQSRPAACPPTRWNCCFVAGMRCFAWETSRRPGCSMSARLRPATPEARWVPARPTIRSSCRRWEHAASGRMRPPRRNGIERHSHSVTHPRRGVSSC
jgi:hypothetical protein